MNRFKSLPPWVPGLVGMAFAITAVVGIILGLTRTIPWLAALAMLLVGLPVSLLMISVTLTSASRIAEADIAEHGVRGVARVRGYEPAGMTARGTRPGRVRLQIELHIPGQPVTTHEYWALVKAIDLPRLTSLGDLPCIAAPGDPPHVRVYVRRDVDAETLDGDPLILMPA